jgi:hypothetical protein
MTDTPAVPIAPPPAGGAAPLAPAEAQAEIARRKSDPAAFLATPPAVMSELFKAAYPAEPSTGIDLSASAAPKLTGIEAAVRRNAEYLVSSGRATRETVNADLAAAGHQPLPQPDTATPTVDDAALDAAFPPGKPTEYTLPKLTAPGEEYTEATAAKDHLARGWMAEARLPVSIGNHIAAEVAAIADKWPAMNDSQRRVYAINERSKLDRLLGADAQVKIEGARRLVAELEAKSPGLVHLLEASGAGNSAAVVVMLAQHAARLAARRGSSA